MILCLSVWFPLFPIVYLLHHSKDSQGLRKLLGSTARTSSVMTLAPGYGEHSADVHPGRSASLSSDLDKWSSFLGSHVVGSFLKGDSCTTGRSCDISFQP